ncbi:Heavy-metal-associated domain-containing protein [Gammaproteobacteria bacterium]
MKLKISGMNCGHCTKTIEQALREVPGVESVAVSLERGEAEITGQATAIVLMEAIRAKGYGAEAL